MRKLCLGLLFLACAFGEDSLTITASRSIALQPDQAVFGIHVMSPLATNLDDVVAALAGLGVTAGNLSYVYSPSGTRVNGTQENLTWNFTLGVPFSKLKDTFATLTALEQSIEQNNSALKLSYSVLGTRVSLQLHDSQSCPIEDLIADARSQAQNLANAAGATVGPILALSDGQGALGSRIALFAISRSSIIFSSVSCAIVVKFSLLRP